MARNASSSVLRSPAHARVTQTQARTGTMPQPIDRPRTQAFHAVTAVGRWYEMYEAQQLVNPLAEAIADGWAQRKA